MKPFLENAMVNFLPQSSNMFNSLPDFLTISQDRVTFDIGNIQGDYDILQFKFDELNWVNVSKRAIITVEDELKLGLHKLNLRIIDEIEQTTKISKMTTFVKGGPTLTGKNIQLKQEKDEVIISYKDVFHNVRYFIICSGSTLGSRDILDFIETKEYELKFPVENVLKLYINIYGVGESGFYVFKLNSFGIK